MHRFRHVFFFGLDVQPDDGGAFGLGQGIQLVPAQAADLEFLGVAFPLGSVPVDHRVEVGVAILGPDGDVDDPEAHEGFFRGDLRDLERAVLHEAEHAVEDGGR